MSRPHFTWFFKMAWRDGRSNINKFLLFVASITIGIAALVSIQSFSDGIESSIEDQSKSLLGADLVLESAVPFTDEFSSAFDTLEFNKSEQVRFASMVLLEKNGASRLVQVRAFEGDFPYYGEIVFQPEGKQLSTIQQNEVFIDENLALVLQAEIGDSLKVGSIYFTIGALVEKIPGEAAVAAFVGPRVFIPLSQLEQTNLIQKGSRITYEQFYKVEEADSIVAHLKPVLEESKVRAQTVSGRKRQLGRALDNLYSFLNLVGFIALLLGAVGVGSSVQVYARQKKNSIALLRCLGVSSLQALLIFMIQIGVMGLIGAAIGTLIGISVVPLFPIVFSDFLPVTISTSISAFALGKGFGIGLVFTLLFALLPLLQARRTSPLATLRISEEPPSVWKDALHWVAISAIVVTMLSFTSIQTKSLSNAFVFILSLSAAFLLLSAVAKLLMITVRKFFPASASFTTRQGLANLYRPNNQTLLMLVSLGLGAFLIMTLLLVQNQLLSQLNVRTQQSETNMVLFDVQSDQVKTVEEVLEEQNMPVQSKVPIVTMRIESANGRSVKTILDDTTRRGRRWAYNREYRTSYRNSIKASETLLSGEFIGEGSLENQPIPITVEKGLLEDLALSLQDTIVWDVQGIPIQTYVAGVREVDWQRVEPNFFVVFPSGVLENAPQFWVVSTRFDLPEQGALAKRNLVNRVPNVSVIDLNVILDTINSILDKITLAIQFMAFFSILTGIIVLISSIIASRFQRIKESVLLRTLGATKKQIEKILVSEFFFIGILATATGMLLSVIATWLLAIYVFKNPFTPDYVLIFSGFAIISFITIAIGWLNSRGSLDLPPLEVLRTET